MKLKLCALLLGILAALGMAEGLLRLFAGRLGLRGTESTESLKPVYRASSELGYEPIPGVEGYNEFKVLDYGYRLSRKQNLVRVLVLGDSVAHRRKWVEALERRMRAFLGAGRFVEFWNAGVEGYNTVQEEAYLRQTGVHLQPDLVIVQFHLNDFLPLPVLFQDAAGQSAMMPFSEGSSGFSPGLFRFSYLYRYWILRWRAGHATATDPNRSQIERAVLGIRQLCQEHGLSLLFVVFPLFKNFDTYTPEERTAYRWILDILARADIDSLDLVSAFASESSMDELREAPNDFWHPNPEGHLRIARLLAERLRLHSVFRSARGHHPVLFGGGAATTESQVPR